MFGMLGACNLKINKMKFLYTKYYIRNALILIILFLITLMIVSLIGLKTHAQPKLISPTSKITEQSNTEQERSLSYYIVTSQEFLNQARSLANNDPDQTPEEKQAIMEKVELALNVINQGIKVYPADDRVYAQRASIYQSLIPFVPEALKYGLADLTQATQINSKNPDYYRRLANLYRQAGDFENAASHYFNAYRLSPTDNQTLFDLADSLEKAGQIDKAIRYYDKLIALLPTNDQNLEALKKQKANLETLLVNSNLEQLSEPGMEMVPQKPVNNPQPIMGTEELPLEQAALASQVIIASPEEKQTSTSVGQTQVNAKTGLGILPAGKTEIIIQNKNVTNDKQIIIVPTSDTQNKVLYLLAKKENEWFKVAIDKPINQDIEFNWWIID